MAESGCRPESDLYVGPVQKNDAINYQPGSGGYKVGNVPVQNDRAGIDIAPRDPKPGS